MLDQTPLMRYFRCSLTRLTQEPLHFHSASLAGSVWAPADFLWVHSDKAPLPRRLSASVLGFPVDADQLSAHVEATGE